MEGASQRSSGPPGCVSRQRRRADEGRPCDGETGRRDARPLAERGETCALTAGPSVARRRFPFLRHVAISGSCGHRIACVRRRRRRGADWNHVHLATDDRTRGSRTAVLRDETAETTAVFLRCDAPRRARAPHAGHLRPPHLVRPRHRVPDAPHRTRDRTAAHRPQTHTAQPNEDEQQGRALHPDPGARAGHRRAVPDVAGPDRRASALAPARQPAPPAGSSPWPTALPPGAAPGVTSVLRLRNHLLIPRPGPGGRARRAPAPSEPPLQPGKFPLPGGPN